MEFQQQPGDYLYYHQEGSHAPEPEGEVETQRRLLHLAGMKMEYQAEPGLFALFAISILVQKG